MCVFVGLITVCNRNDFLALARNLDKMFLFSFPIFFNICLTVNVNLYSHGLICICLCFYKQWTVQKKSHEINACAWQRVLVLVLEKCLERGQSEQKNNKKQKTQKTERERLEEEECNCDNCVSTAEGH